MQTVVLPEPLPCTDFVKARERLLQLALRHIPHEYRNGLKIERVIRRAIEYVFQDASGWFTYNGVLKAKHVFRYIDRNFDEDAVAVCMNVVLDTYKLITGTDLYRLPDVERYAGDYAFYLTLREPLGSVALAWQIICNNTLVLTREQLMLL